MGRAPRSGLAVAPGGLAGQIARHRRRDGIEGGFDFPEGELNGVDGKYANYRRPLAPAVQVLSASASRFSARKTSRAATTSFSHGKGLSLVGSYLGVSGSATPRSFSSAHAWSSS